MDTPIEVVDDVVATREVPKPVEVKQKPRAAEATTRTLPKRGAEVATAMGLWADGPPNDKRMVVVDESSVGVSRRERREVVETTPVARSTEAGSEVGRQSVEKEELGTPVFDDMEEPTVEIAVWTTAR